MTSLSSGVTSIASIPCASFNAHLRLNCARQLALGSADRRLKEKNCLAGSDCGLVFPELLAAPRPGVAAHRTGHRDVVREVALGRAMRAVVAGGGEHRVMPPGLEPFHDSFVVEAIGR